MPSFHHSFTEAFTVPGPVLSGAGETAVTETALDLPSRVDSPVGAQICFQSVTILGEQGWDGEAERSLGTQRVYFPQPAGY